MATVILILLLVGLVVVYANRNKNPELYKLLMIVLVALTFVMLLVRMTRRDRPERDIRRTMLQFSDAVAEHMGAHVAGTLPDGGQVIFLQLMPDRDHERSRLQNLRRGLGGRFRVEVVEPPAPEIMDDPEIAMLELLDESVLPLPAFLEVLERYPDAVAIVSTRWAPLLRSGERPPAAMPPIFVLESGEEPWVMADLMRQGVVSAFVTVRRDARWDQRPERGMNAAEVFALRYTLVTRENLREVERFFEEDF